MDGSESGVPPFGIAVDERTGIIEIAARGFWTPSDLDEHIAQLQEVLVSIRRQFGIAKVMVDLRESHVQSQAIFDQLRDATHAIYQERDRIALVMDSALLAMQMRRLSAKAGRAAFSDAFAARSWLLEARPGP